MTCCFPLVLSWPGNGAAGTHTPCGCWHCRQRLADSSMPQHQPLYTTLDMCCWTTSWWQGSKPHASRLRVSPRLPAWGGIPRMGPCSLTICPGSWRIRLCALSLPRRAPSGGWVQGTAGEPQSMAGDRPRPLLVAPWRQLPALWERWALWAWPSTACHSRSPSPVLCPPSAEDSTHPQTAHGTAIHVKEGVA